jgi:hypothetical protein
VVVLLLPLFLARNDSEFDHRKVAVVVVVAWWQRQRRQ